VIAFGTPFFLFLELGAELGAEFGLIGGAGTGGEAGV
jgi:hypothetical protein